MKSWDTHHLSPNHRFGYWRDVLCEAFTALDSTASSHGDHASQVTLHELGDVNAADLSSFSQVVTRGQAEIRRRADEFFFANLQLQGDCRVEQDGRQICARPGSFYLVDTTRPYTLDFEQTFHTLSFRVPHHRMTPLLGGDPRKVTATLIDSSDTLGGLATAHMTALMRCAPNLSPAVSDTLATTLASLISIAVTGPASANDSSRVEARRAFRESIVRYVRSRTADPLLSVASVASHFRVSTRYVHEVFSEQDASFVQTVLEHRLVSAAHLLGEPACSVTQVALGCGFGDLSYFGRAFRKRYGCSPAQWRREAAAAALSLPSPR